jgi:hypothetical protein
MRLFDGATKPAGTSCGIPLVAYAVAEGEAALAGEWTVVWSWARADGWRPWFDTKLLLGGGTETEEQGKAGFSCEVESKTPEELFVKSCT